MVPARRAELLMITEVLSAGLPFAVIGGRPVSPGRSQQPPLPAHAHAAVTGISGWQIALIAAGAALLSAALTVVCYRVRDARRRVTVSAT
jgi:4-amino-4-deoxy-L-arabinose transferase-like glycosyltransferase